MELRVLFLIYVSITCYCFAVEAGHVDVRSLGYNGTWDEFCDHSNIEKEFAGYTDHDVLRIRMVLCDLKKNDKITRQSITTFCAYKYCNIIRSDIEYLYKKLKEKFNEHFTRKTEETSTSARLNDQCYTKTEKIFHRKCIAKQNPCIRMFQSLLSGICVKPGITVEDISRYIVNVCKGKYISDEINWEPLLMTIQYRE